VRSICLIKIVLLGLVGLLATTSSSLSQTKCNPRVGYPAVLYDNQHFAGLYRVPLNPPDLQDHVAVQRHLAFLEDWGRTIWRESLARTRGLCHAQFVPYGFPDARIAVIVDQTSSQITREKVFCAKVIQDIFQHFEPSDEQIRNAVESRKSSSQPPHLLPREVESSPAEDAWHIGLTAPGLIYEKNSTLNALTSWRAISSMAVSATELRAWIEDQRARALLEEMPHCLPPHGDLSSSDDVPEARSRSAILPPGDINLSRGDNRLPPGPLRFAVVVGNPTEPPAGLLPPAAENSYCRRDHTFGVDDGSSHFSLTIRPRCDPILLGDLDAWLLLYCDPKDCTSEAVEKMVMTSVARDPEIMDFARRSSNAATPRGPYFIIIN
jgi:hypothetical protein